MLIGDEINLIINDLNNHYIKLIKTDKPQNLTSKLHRDLLLMSSLTQEIKQEIIIKGVVINDKGNKIPLHLYPLCLSFLDCDANVQRRILKYLSTFQQVILFTGSI